jgi:hypothetical protein
VSAVTAEQCETLPDLARFTERQLLGIDCARCGRHLRVHARELGEFMDHGYLLWLWSCDPGCRLPRRERFAAWPPGGPRRPPP